MALTSAQIVARACQRARVPGYSQQGGQYLNLTLQELAQRYDFEFIRQTATVTIGPGMGTGPNNAFYAVPLTNPAVGYLRTYDVFYTINGTCFWLTPYDAGLSDYDQQFQGAGINDYPYKYITRLTPEVSAAQIGFYPPPNISIPVTVRFFPQLGDIGSGAWTTGSYTDNLPPEQATLVPWFPNTRYLITQVTAQLMEDTDDPRAEKTYEIAEGILSGFLAMDDDKEGRVRRVTLDPNFFRGNGVVKLTKDQPLP